MRCSGGALLTLVLARRAQALRPLAPAASADRRSWLGTCASGLSAGLGAAPAARAASLLPPRAEATAPAAGRGYFPTLLPPLFSRATVRYELGDGLWAFEQLLVFANVSATVRMNVVRLRDGGLWVSAPVYPTGELKQLLAELGGDVRYIVLPTNALEHKAPLADFARAYPAAEVWSVPVRVNRASIRARDKCVGARARARGFRHEPAPSTPRARARSRRGCTARSARSAATRGRARSGRSSRASSTTARPSAASSRAGSSSPTCPRTRGPSRRPRSCTSRRRRCS